MAFAWLAIDVFVTSAYAVTVARRPAIAIAAVEPENDTFNRLLSCAVATAEMCERNQLADSRKGGRCPFPSREARLPTLCDRKTGIWSATYRSGGSVLWPASTPGPRGSLTVSDAVAVYEVGRLNPYRAAGIVQTRTA